MKKFLLAVCLSLLSLTVFAQDSEQGDGTVVNPPMQQMQARMQAMRAQMEQIQATEDPEERRRLIQEHMRSMQAGMMMGEMMRGAPPDRQMQQCQETDTECRMNQMQLQQRMMGQRMGMMQQMMAQMMQQSMQQQPPYGDAAENHEEHH